MIRPTLLLLLLATPAAAQDSRNELWLSGQASASVAGASVSIDTTTRFGEDGLYQWTLGGFAGAELRGVDLAIGFQHGTDYADGRIVRTEERLRQQASFAIAGPLSARLRFEQRFRSDGRDTGLRLRGRLQLGVPLGAVTLVGWHESFVELNDTDWGQDAGYRRMRNFAGLEAPVAPAVKLQAGYLNQYDFARNGGRDQMANVASLGLAARF